MKPRVCWICGAFHPRGEKHRIFHDSKRKLLAELRENLPANCKSVLLYVELRNELFSIPHPRVARFLNWWIAGRRLR